MKVQLLILIAIVGLAVYESYLKGPVQQVLSYAQTAGFIAMGAYLIYSYYKSPQDFKVAVDFARTHLSHSNGGALRQIDRILEGKPKLHRQVSPLLKKKVAANQEWKCGHCKNLFDASFEVDHIVPLFKGGSNNESNLVALCRNCHGRKTVEDRLGFL